jgi:hypothetical protein
MTIVKDAAAAKRVRLSWKRRRRDEDSAAFSIVEMGILLRETMSGLQS